MLKKMGKVVKKAVGGGAVAAASKNMAPAMGGAVAAAPKKATPMMNAVATTASKAAQAMKANPKPAVGSALQNKAIGKAVGGLAGKFLKRR